MAGSISACILWWSLITVGVCSNSQGEMLCRTLHAIYYMHASLREPVLLLVCAEGLGTRLIIGLIVQEMRRRGIFLKVVDEKLPCLCLSGSFFVFFFIFCSFP